MRRNMTFLIGSSLIAATLTTACRNDAPTDPSPAVAKNFTATAVRSDSLALMRSVARGLAVALADNSVRADVRAAITRSTAREKKLHLQRFLLARGSDLGRSIGRKSQFGELGWTRAVLQLPDIEMYMPIPAQRAAWRGTNDVLVAGFLETDDEIRAAGGMVTAYRTDGSAVKIAYNAVPKQPVIVIYPVETAFGTDGESAVATTVDAQSVDPNLIFDPGPTPVPSACTYNNPNGANLYLCHTSIPSPGQYEEFLRGSPEFSLAMFSFIPGNAASRRRIACVNEDQTGSRFYQQDTDWWDGKALLLSRVALQTEQSAGRHILAVHWEDDNGSKCDLNPEGNQVFPWVDLHNWSFIAGLVGVGQGGLGGWALASIAFGVSGLGLMFATSGDDLVGSVVIPSASDPLTNPKELRRERSVISGKVTFMIY